MKAPSVAGAGARRRHVLLAAVGLPMGLAPAFGANAADAPTRPLVLVPNWRTGEQLRYQLVKERLQKARQGRPSSADSRTDLFIQVVEAGAEVRVIELRFGPTQVRVNGVPPSDPLVERMSSLNAGLRLRVDVSAQGELLRLVNWEEVRTLGGKVVDALGAELQAKGVDEAVLGRVLQSTRSLFASENAIQAVFTKEIQLLLACMGKPLTSDKPHVYETRLANPLGGAPIPAEGRYTLGRVDVDRQQATVRWVQTPDAAAMARAMSASMAAVSGASSGASAPTLPADFQVRDEAEYLIDMPTGWVQRLHHTRSIQAGGQSRIDVTRLERWVGEPAPEAR